MDKFTRQYFETALWSSTDNADDQGGEPLDKNFSVSDIADETRDKMIADCADFQERFGELYTDSEQAGHDFWLSRNGHGAGFFDGDEERKDELQDAAKSYGEFNLYVGDDGEIHGTPLGEPGAGEARGRTRETKGHRVADFNTLPELIQHAGTEGATHVIVSSSKNQAWIYFPRGDGSYEEARTWQKSGYWHAEGPGSRDTISRLPRSAKPIEWHARRGAAEARRTDGPRLEALDFFRGQGFDATQAKDLANAEQKSHERGWHVDWEDDPEGIDSIGDIDPATIREILSAVLRDENGNVLASLGSIVDPDRKYGRVVEAELALEALNDPSSPGKRRAAEEARGSRNATAPGDENRSRLASYIAHAVMYDVATSEHDLVAAYHLTPEEARAVLSERGGWYGPGGKGYGAFVKHIEKSLRKKEWFSAPDPKAIPGSAQAYGRYVWLLENASDGDHGAKDKSDAEDLERQLSNVGFNGWGLAIDNWPEAARYYNVASSVYRNHSRNTDETREHSVRDYIAVDRNDRRVAGPFKSRHEADAHVPPGGHVKFATAHRRGPPSPAPSSYPMFRAAKEAGGRARRPKGR